MRNLLSTAFESAGMALAGLSLLLSLTVLLLALAIHFGRIRQRSLTMPAICSAVMVMIAWAFCVPAFGGGGF